MGSEVTDNVWREAHVPWPSHYANKWSYYASNFIAAPASSKPLPAACLPWKASVKSLAGTTSSSQASLTRALQYQWTKNRSEDRVRACRARKCLSIPMTATSTINMLTTSSPYHQAHRHQLQIPHHYKQGWSHHQTLHHQAKTAEKQRQCIKGYTHAQQHAATASARQVGQAVRENSRGAEEQVCR